MFVTKIMIATTTMLMALAANAACRADAAKEKDTQQAGTVITMFPDGLEYNFGKVARGTQCKRSFCFLNTSKVPLEIISLRCS